MDEMEIYNSPIVFARKPLEENTVVDNVLKWGTGGINIDESRIPTDDNLGSGATNGSVLDIEGFDRPWMHDTERMKEFGDKMKDKVNHAQTFGRFPANLILDTEAAKVLDEQSGISKSTSTKTGYTNPTKNDDFFKGLRNKVTVRHNDEGGASRFFYQPNGDDDYENTDKKENNMRLLLGDCLDKLKELEDNSIDSIVTDPPYGLSAAPNSGKSSKGGFMGKQWDYDVPSVDIWKECLRVLKPGGHLLAFAGSRTYHRMAVRIEDAGFEIRDQIMWVYGSGFPKSHNIGKAVDKIEGNEREDIGLHERQNYKKGGAGFRQLGNDELKTDYRLSKGTSQWEGWGTALKPAHEPIVMARKPLSEKTVGNNVLEWGTGGINIDGCRIGTDETITNHSRSAESAISKGKYGDSSEQETHQTEGQLLGRFPANIIFDEEAGEMLDEQTGILNSGFMKAGTARLMSDNPNKNTYGKWNPDTVANDTYGDSGGASRFFYSTETDNINDDIWQHPLNVSTAQKSLYQQEQVDDFVASLVAIRDNREDKQLRNMILPFMNEMQIVLKNTTEKDITKMILLGEKFSQELQLTITEKLKEFPVKYVEIQKLINIMMIIQNLLSIDGFVENITSNTILSSMVLGDQGSLTRFKYCPKVSKSERNEGLTLPNPHPTLKPVDLMLYLIRLVTPKGGVTLDPFMGSGSSGKAAVRGGFDFIGIEREDEYFKIAEARIEYEKKKPIIVETPTGKKVEVKGEVEEKINQFFG
jgi:DNA modification methylase